MTTVVTGKRQITVPVEIARDFGIEVGTRVEWGRTRNPNQIVITVQPSRGQLLDKIAAIGRKYKNKKGDWVKELCEEREHDDVERMKEFEHVPS
jgi:bifunctional DNA-binding transcriptional regulator/antitoxin component of YhaV-PrlF toxin-antitoxin module